VAKVTIRSGLADNVIKLFFSSFTSFREIDSTVSIAFETYRVRQGAYPSGEHLKGVLLVGKLRPYLQTLEKGWEGLTGTNALAH
jgi:hypothetical protein